MSLPALPLAARLGGPLYYAGLRALGVPAMNRRLQDAGVILCYHNVVSSGAGNCGDPGLHLSCERFERQMRWLKSRYAVVTMNEFVNRLVKGRSLHSIAAVTFDDGYAGVFEHAIPILRDLNLPATVFLVADAPGNAEAFWWDHPEILESLTSDQRRQFLTLLRGDGAAITSRYPRSANCGIPASHRAADWTVIRSRSGSGIDVGVHSATHRSLPTLTESELDRELVISREQIHEATGVWPTFFAYPYGCWDTRVRDRVRAAGYLAALTLDSGLNRASADLWSLRRVNVPARISSAAFEAWLAGLHSPRRH